MSTITTTTTTTAPAPALPTTADTPLFAQLLRDGYVIIPSVIPIPKTEEYIDEAYTWLEGFNLGFKRGDKSTWKVDMLPATFAGGLHTRYRISHEDWLWRIRSEPGVINAFARLWGTPELLVSFDGANITLPIGEGGRDDIPQMWVWPHTDQSPHVEGFLQCQGIIAISENGPKDGGLVIMTGSHLLHSKYHAEHGGIDEERRAGQEHGYRWQESDLPWYTANGCEQYKVECPAGSVIVWDSRTIHWNRIPDGGRTRVATYASYCPRAFASEECLKEKAEVFKTQGSTDHWPVNNRVKHDLAMRGDTPCPHNRDGPINPVKPTPTILQLAGVIPY